MAEPSIRIEQKDHVHYLSGVIDFITAPIWLAQTEALFQRANKQIEFNLANISKVNSAGMALCIEWLRLANHHACKLRIHACPSSLLHLTKAAGMYELLQPVLD